MPGLVDQRAHDGGKRRRIESRPDASPQRLGCEEVLLRVEAPELLTQLGCGRTGLVEVPELGQHVADPLEGLGDRARPTVDLALERGRLALQAPPALGPSRVVLTLGALVARVRLHPP